MAALSLKNVGVSFPIYDARQRSLRNRILGATTGGRLGTDEKRRIVVQALEGVNVELRQGDRLALIGHNGAGKTTLLRVMAGIYEPLVGSVTIEGTVAPLFDISLGMNPETSGYENIWLRAHFLGIPNRDVPQLTHQVAEFSELGDFLYLPLRTYSDGMRTRLAFAISTAIKPQILLLDEGLGAGDSKFLDKASRRMEELIRGAGIMVLASHSTELVTRFCTSALLLERGRAVANGALADIVREYRSPLAA
jgi:ABC-2 type transport system ATP-binding protein/lipopolysaccharide transport system ATP-binding protein